jgi:hypothetical protein
VVRLDEAALVGADPTLSIPARCVGATADGQQHHLSLQRLGGPPLAGSMLSEHAGVTLTVRR